MYINHSPKKTYLVLCMFLGVSSALGVCGCAKPQVERQAPPLPEVVVDKAIVKDVQLYVNTRGTTAASHFVEVPARVTGYLKEMEFKPGDMVQEGQPLFEIEPDDYLAVLKSNEAQLQVDKAKEQLAKANLARTAKLFKSQTVSPEDYDTAVATQLEAQANIDRTKAAIERATLNLSYTKILAPIRGKTSVEEVQVGNLVGPGSANTTLVSIANMDPIYVYFDITNFDFNEVFSKSKRPLPAEPPLTEPEVPNAQSGDSSPEGRGLGGEFYISLMNRPSDGDIAYPYRGKITLTDNRILDDLGTIRLRGEIPNPDYTIFPGQICRVRIPKELLTDAVLIREEAVNFDLNTTFVLLVDETSTVRRRNIEIGELIEGRYRLVTAGLSGDETYIHQGIQRARIDAQVVPVTTEEYEKRFQTVPPEATPTTETAPDETTNGDSDGDSDGDSGNDPDDDPT